jgi:sortase A
MRFFRVGLILILLAGACLTARAGYLHAKAALAGVLIRHAWEESLRTGENHRPWPWADTHPVARLRIPRLGYDEIVLEGATLRTLAFGPARLRSGAAPGEPGNLVLAGHRTNWFRRLEAVRLGDSVELEWRDTRRGGLRRKNYVIEELRVVTPGDVALLAPTNDDALTLVTCYPFGRGPTSPLRFIVRAAPAAPDNPARIEYTQSIERRGRLRRSAQIEVR